MKEGGLWRWSIPGCVAGVAVLVWLLMVRTPVALFALAVFGGVVIGVLLTLAAMLPEE